MTQIPYSAYLPFPQESADAVGGTREGAIDLLFSVASRPTIELEPRTATPQRFRLQWCPVPISLAALTKLLDGLILLCAVLIFAVMSLIMTNILPAWPVTVILAVGITAVFVALYWFLFVFWMGATPGAHLARMAHTESEIGMYSEREEQPRFP